MKMMMKIKCKLMLAIKHEKKEEKYNPEKSNSSYQFVSAIVEIIELYIEKEEKENTALNMNIVLF